MNEPPRSRCAYCDFHTSLYWSGRRWICRACMIDQQGVDPSKADSDERKTNG